MQGATGVTGRASATAMVAVAALVMMLAVAPGSSAQTELAGVYGRVTDPSGAVIVDAEVEIRNTETGISTTVKTNQNGLYTIPSLHPGQYLINVRKPGFQSVTVTELTLNVQDNVVRNFSLQVGSISESVTVRADDAHINTTDASVSTVIDRQFVESVPLNGRSFNTLLQMIPGVVIVQQPIGATSPGQFSIAGQRPDANNFTVDGASANFGVSSSATLGESGAGTAQAFSALGGTSSLVSIDALQEFRVETSSFAPEFGRSPGGQVVLTTRAGTNSFHGGIFDYFRNTVMDANDWFANQGLLPRAPEHHNDFGGFLGGPILRDKSFFFFSYEGARLVLPHTQQLLVPSAYARSVAPTAVAPFLNAYPQPHDRTITTGVYAAQFTGNFSNPASLNATSIRLDHTFNTHFSIFGRYNNAPSQTVTHSAFVPSEVDTINVNTQTLTIGVNTVSSSLISNVLRGNYSSQQSRFSQALSTLGGAVPLNTSPLLGPLSPRNTQVLFFSSDIAGPYASGPSADNRTRQFDLVDDLSVARGEHAWKFGGDYRAIPLDVVPFRNLVGFFASSVEDLVDTQTLTFLATSTQNSAKILTQSASLYAQDSWKISPRLSVTYGLRWELSPPPSARGTTQLTAWKDVDEPAQLALAPRGTPLWRTRYTNFGPRLGVAYSLDHGGDFVLRAGAGIFYDLGLGSAANLAADFPNTLNAGFPGVSLPIGDPTPFLPIISLQPPYPAGVVIEGFSPNLQLPRSYQWNVALEKSFKGRDAVSITYVGQAGRKELRQQSLAQPNANFQGPFYLTLNDARSNYHALQMQYRRPLSSRFHALLSYSYSHSLDNASNDVIAGLSNTVISAANDYASSNFDVRQSFSGALVYAIPSWGKSGVLYSLSGGWSLDSVIVVRTGFPFNANIAAPSALGVSFTRPDRVAGQPEYLYGSQCASTLQAMNALLPGQFCPGGMGLNPAAFDAVSPTNAGRQGTEGRNDMTGFGLTQIDLSLNRSFAITERMNLEFRTDAFNLFNHPNFTNPGANLSYGNGLVSETMLNQGLGGLNPLFQSGGPRSLQLSLKFTF